MKEQGIALFQDSDKFHENQRIFQLILLDTTLTESHKMDIEMQNKWQMIGYEYSRQTLYFLFRSGDNEAADLQLVTVPLETREIQRNSINHEFSFKLTHFSVVNKNVVLGGYVGREPAVLVFDPDKNQLKVIPGFFTSDTELLDVRVNENNTFNTLVTNRSTRSKRTLLLRTFDHSGRQLLEDEVTIDQKKTILSALTSSLVRDEMIISGTYTYGNSKQAAGFFSVQADPFSDQPVNYYDFAQLGHFLDYMAPKRADRIKAAAKRSREHGRDPEFRTYTSSVRLEERPQGFFFLAESYVMSSGSGAYPGMPYAPYGNYPYGYGYSPYSPLSNRFYNSPYYMNNQPVNNDIEYKQSSVMVFTPDGKLEWDHELNIEEGKRRGMEQLTDFWSDRNKIVIVGKEKSNLSIQSRYKNDDSKKEEIKVMLKNPTDVVRHETEDNGGVRYWYDNKLYVWGYQSLKDQATDTEDRLRSVFYLIRIDVQ